VTRVLLSDRLLKERYDAVSQTCDYVETKKKKYDVDDEDNKKYERRVHRHEDSTAWRRKTESSRTFYALRSSRSSGELYALLVSLVLHIRLYIVGVHVRREAPS